MFAEVVELAIDVSSVAAHHRGEGTELHPAHVEFLILRVACGRVVTLCVVGASEEATDVGIHVRVSGEGVVKTDRHLLAEAIP